jgi:hypothetical protein
MKHVMCNFSLQIFLKVTFFLISKEVKLKERVVPHWADETEGGDY